MRIKIHLYGMACDNRYLIDDKAGLCEFNGEKINLDAAKVIDEIAGVIYNFPQEIKGNDVTDDISYDIMVETDVVKTFKARNARPENFYKLSNVLEIIENGNKVVRTR